MIANIDHYEIKAQLNSKFPRHYLAIDPRHDREVVLKTLPPPEEMARLDFVSYYQKEAAIASQIDHPALPKLYDTVVTNEQIYLVYEYLPGTRSLEDILQANEGPLPAATVVAWAIQVCELLAYLHNHRPHPIILADLKPDNILLDSNGRIRIVDFGIINQAPDGWNKSADKIGTEGYSPPEQYRGELCPASDMYALAATMHHLLTGMDPRQFEPFSWAERPLHQFNPTIGERLEAIVMTALEAEPKNRFPSAEAMQSALEKVRPDL